eukprot:GAFH01001038.1.p1 GENE.GAFH01001038.1~~GAFH01001038.1.p1  ORF type:complete len:528 (+),score=154.18 GAFH01001038.1:110-1585(+)
MTPGLAFFYGGLVRRKNVLSIMMQSFISMGVVTVIWMVFGFSLSFGRTGYVYGNPFDFIGLRDVGLNPDDRYGASIPLAAFFVFQEMFAVITPALITGAFADRVAFGPYLIFLIFWVLLVYAPVCHWIWGGGWMAMLGIKDFAGGMVVHATAGTAALVSVMIVGSRRLKPGEVPAPHNVAFVALGTGMLWFGWFGFNGGSALAANGQAALAWANTDIAGSMAMVTWMVMDTIRTHHPSMVSTLTGAVAGLATVTPAAGYIRPWAAVVFGLLAGVVCYMACELRKKMKLDDALDVFGCHGVGGLLGTVLLGIFADESVGGYGGAVSGKPIAIAWQLLGATVTCAWSFVMSYAIMRVIDRFWSMRVPADVEEKGLDLWLHGEVAYHFYEEKEKEGGDIGPMTSQELAIIPIPTPPNYEPREHPAATATVSGGMEADSAGMSAPAPVASPAPADPVLEVLPAPLAPPAAPLAPSVASTPVAAAPAAPQPLATDV